MAVEASVVAVIMQAVLVLFIGTLIGKKFSFEGAIANGVVVIFAGGTLLYHGKALGFLLLTYGAAIMIAAMKERDLKKLEGKSDFLGYVVMLFGNYIITALIIILMAMLSYNVWPFVPA
jgi:hypothetical protein